MRFLAVIFGFLLPITAFGGEQWFRRDADEISWVLSLARDHYQVESCDLAGRMTKAEGKFSDHRSWIEFEDSEPSGKPSIVHGERLLKKKVGDVLYLVEEDRLKEFDECLVEKSGVARSMGLANFFHKIQKPEGTEKEANQSPQTTPVSAPR